MIFRVIPSKNGGRAMKAKLFAVLVLGMVLGFAASFVGRHSDARAADAAVKWEYKTVRLEGGVRELDKVNEEGYEFVAISPTGGSSTGCVAVFKRPKK
jgi:hypothetical protein